MITGASGLPGRYLHDILKSSAPQPELTLFHCAGTEEDDRAEELNTVATANLLDSLGDDVPRRLVYVSSWQVYSPDAGEGVDETRPTFARSEAGRSKARTELLLEKWAAARGVVLTGVRPALMFGTGIDGSMKRLFDRVVAGRYVHIRGNDAKMSAVTALDVARAMVRLAGTPGIFNISDGRSHTWLSLAEAMSANAGAVKRMPHLPPRWASAAYRWLGSVPWVADALGPGSLEPVSRTLVLDNTRVRQATGMEFHDTIEVIARRSNDYPYEN